MEINKLFLLKQIETPRLIIRPVKLGDEIQLNQAINNSLISLQEYMFWASDPSLECTRNFIRTAVLASSSYVSKDFPMVVIHKKDHKIIGGTGYNEHSRFEEGLYEIGYWCDVDYRGRGYVTEYVNALTRYAINELQAKLVVLRIQVNNTKSLAIAKRLNFYNQGTKLNPTKKEVIDYYFTCSRFDDLPNLEISWIYKKYDL